METTNIDIHSMSHKELLSFTEKLLVAFNEAMLRIAALELEVEKLRRDKNNNSGNSSKPSSTDQKRTKDTKAANQYNQRTKSGKAPGGQEGHAGKTLTKEIVQKKISKGELKHRIVDIGGSASEKYISKYILDLRVVAEAVEVRIHADEDGQFVVPEELRSDVIYGPTMKSLGVLLYSEGIMSNDRICNVLNFLSGGNMCVSEGSVYGFCQQYADKCQDDLSGISKELSEAAVLYTDATAVTTNGRQTIIRNISTPGAVIYASSDRKNLKSLRDIEVLNNYQGILVHDHETALYQFGNGHGECNAHIIRYLKKNTEETGNAWGQEMHAHLCATLSEKKERIGQGASSFSEDEFEAISLYYDAIIARGWEQNANTKGYHARTCEQRLLRRLAKYKRNHLLFAHDFRVDFTNNLSERDLRKIKGRQKIAGGFRKASGREMYCKIMSVAETLKRRCENLLEKIKQKFAIPLVDLGIQPV